jgi:hypothetical protein
LRGATFRNARYPVFNSPSNTACTSRDSQIEAQMKVMNEDFAKSGFSFNLVNTSRVMNAGWFSNVDPDKYCFYHFVVGYLMF